jgi:hypothetical protein
VRPNETCLLINIVITANNLGQTGTLKDLTVHSPKSMQVWMCSISENSVKRIRPTKINYYAFLICSKGLEFKMSNFYSIPSVSFTFMNE